VRAVRLHRHLPDRANARPHGPDDGDGGRQRAAARGAGLDLRQVNVKTAGHANVLTGDARGIRIAVVKEGFGHANSETDVHALVRKGAATFKRLGAQVGEVSIPLHLAGPAIWTPIAACVKDLYITSLIDAHSSWRHRGRSPDPHTGRTRRCIYRFMTAEIGSTGGRPSSRKQSTAAKPEETPRGLVLGQHPSSAHPFGQVLSGNDGTTISKVPHRALSERGARVATVEMLREMIGRHHVSPEALARTAQHREAMERLGLGSQQAQLRRFPTNPATQKGNLAEIVLADYIVTASGLLLPIYRLRYNPNVDQSMKGDDVLAFDLDARPVRIVVGEAKFRGTSSAAAVTEIVDALTRSHKAGIPVSLQFVADRLFEVGDAALAARVLDCARLFALGRLRIDYVGLLLSDAQAAARVNAATTPGSLRHLAMISLGLTEPDTLIDPCYTGLE